MIVTRTRAELADALALLRADGATVALVPTMGLLHDGHLSIVDRAAELADHVVVSLFVSRLQLGPGDDPFRHALQEARDEERLRAPGVALVFAPSEEEMYPDGEPQVTIAPGPLALRLDGAFLPGRFRGTLTTVALLFGLVRPDVAVFGLEDFQRVALVRRMVRDLGLGVRVETAPIVREADGVAMSRRNEALSPEERREARGLNEALVEATRYFGAGERRAEVLLDVVHAVVGRHPLLQLQYADVVDPGTLASVETAVPGSVVALAAFCGTVRLADNVVL